MQLNPSPSPRQRWAADRIEDIRRRRRLQERVKSRQFTIFACNCWGGHVYQDLHMPYLTPLVGLYLQTQCFLGFVENLEEAVSAPLEFVEESRYNGKLPFPIGLIMGVYEIHFVHYASREEAAAKWNRRRERIVKDLDDCFFMLMHLSDDYVPELGRFNRLPFRNKVLFTDFPIAGAPEAVIIPPENGLRTPEDGPMLYRRCHRYFDLARWLNKEQPETES